MNKIALRNLLVAGVVALAVTGCSTDKKVLSDINDAKTSADAAQSTATSAQEAAKNAQGAAANAQNSADSAMSTAKEALEKARLALENSEKNKAEIDALNEKIDRMFKKSMNK